MNASAGHILTLNAGSSSLKLAVFSGAPPLRRLLSGTVTRIGLAGAELRVKREGEDASDDSPPRSVAAPDHAAALAAVLEHVEPRYPLARARAVGHRIVHGGPRFERATRITSDVLAELERLHTLDPDHMPSAVAILRAMIARAPDLPQVASFDTAFHRTMPRVAQLLAVPARFQAEGLRRYGFHGLSYTFLIEELAKVAGEEAARGRVVLAHLGSGASLCAVRDGRSIETTMGFTPTSGIPMGTRSGDLDPGVVLYLAREHGLGVDALDDLLNRRSGLLGVSDSSPDMRDLCAREAEDPRARDAVDLFCYQARKAIGALAAALGGLETLVFAGGIGERSAAVRARIAAGLEHLGVYLDDARNAAGASVISSGGSACVVRILHTDEESILAREALHVIDDREKPSDE